MVWNGTLFAKFILALFYFLQYDAAQHNKRNTTHCIVFSLDREDSYLIY